MFSLDLVVKNHTVRYHIMNVISKQFDMNQFDINDVDINDGKFYIKGYSKFDDVSSFEISLIFDIIQIDNCHKLSLILLEFDEGKKVADMDINPTFVKEITNYCQKLFNKHFKL